MVERKVSSYKRVSGLILVVGVGVRVAYLSLELLEAGERLFERLCSVGHDDLLNCIDVSSVLSDVVTGSMSQY